MRCDFSAFVTVGKLSGKERGKRSTEERNADLHVDQHCCRKCSTSDLSNVSHRNVTVVYRKTQGLHIECDIFGSRNYTTNVCSNFIADIAVFFSF